jgi:predicted dienelactone hydrolase
MKTWMLAAIAVLVFAVGCAAGGVPTPEPSPTPTPTAAPAETPALMTGIRLPPPTGPYAVGRTLYLLADSARPEVHTSAPDDFRTLLVEVWYPAEVTGAQPGPYMNAGIAASFGLPAALNASLPYAVLGAPLAGAVASCPVLIFNPGFSAMQVEYTTLVEDLASHGYVVFALSHPYVTITTPLAEGLVAVYEGPDWFEQLWSPRDPYLAELIDVWVPDTRFVMDNLDGLNTADPSGQFTGKLALDRIGLLGHSFGGRTSSEVCRIDGRCAAALSLDGGNSPYVVAAGLPVPYLHIAAGDTQNETYLSEVRALFDDATHDIYLLAVEDAGHYDFADGYFIAESLDQAAASSSYGTVGAEQMLAITRSYVRAFFDRYLRDVDSPLLHGPSPDFPEVAFEARHP